MFIVLAAGLGFFEIRNMKRDGSPARAYVIYAALLTFALALAGLFFLSEAFSLTDWLPEVNPPYGGSA